MKRKIAKTKEVEAVVLPTPKLIDHVENKEGIAIMTQEFGSGDMNVLRDKINEIISRL